MVSIHGIVYIMVGATVSIISYYLDQQKLLFFIVVGGILILVGLLKLLLVFIRKKALPQKHSYQGQYAQAQSNQAQSNQARSTQPQSNQHQGPQNRPQNPAHIFCPRCRRTIHATFNFCPYCGLRI
ncbi:MAG: hypothetical protein ACQESG_01580 [Nanobdellota archaeon]